MDDREREVWEAVQALNRTWTAGRLDELPAYFHADMTAITPMDPGRLEGRAACLGSWERFVRAAKVLRFEERNPRVRFHGEAAVVAYDYAATCEVGGRTSELRGRDLLVLVRQDGRWQVTADHFSPEPAGREGLDESRMRVLADEFLAAWNTQDVERVLACYTDDLEYLDPNTRGPVRGAEAMRRYLGKLFAAWRMTWQRREAHLWADRRGCALLWRATFQRAGGGPVVEADGMDLVEMRGERIARNEVRFDRGVLQALA